MGSSGAGKTTLLNCLAGQLPFNKGLEFTGHISVNGIPAGDSRHSQAYIQQDDVFYSQLTVRQGFHCILQRLPHHSICMANHTHLECFSQHGHVHFIIPQPRASCSM